MSPSFLRGLVRKRARSAADGPAENQLTDVEIVLAAFSSLTPAVQPIVDLRTGLVVGFEALSRFPALPGTSPADVFHAARRAGVGAELEGAAIRAALALPGRPEGTYLSLNLSPSVLVAGGLALLPADLRGIVIEVTEHELVREGAALERALSGLRARGARIAVDDAGVGYAGFGQIVRVAPDIVKLDRSLIGELDGDRMKAALVESFVLFARRLGVLLCAEGIETDAELRAAADLDVVYGQGYGLARPGEPWPEVAAASAAACREALSDVMRNDFTVADAPHTGDWTLERLVERIAGVSSLDDMEAVLELLTVELGADEAYFSEYLRDESCLETIAAHGWQPTGDRYSLADYPATAEILEAHKVTQVLASDPAADPREAAVLAEFGYLSALLVPVVAGGSAIGLLEVYTTQAERPWSRAEICRARIIALQLGTVLLRLYERNDDVRGRRALRALQPGRDDAERRAS